MNNEQETSVCMCCTVVNTKKTKFDESSYSFNT